MTHDTLVCYDLYLRHTDGNGRSRVERHRVWDGDRLFASLAAAAKKAAEEALRDDKPYMHKVERASEADFLKERK